MKTFNEDQLINLIQSVGKAGGGVAAGYGAATSNLWTAVIGAVIALVSWWYSHHANATPPSDQAPAPTATVVIPAAALKVLTLGLLLAGLAVGCATAVKDLAAVNGAAVQSVDQAMTQWSAYTQTHTVSSGSILSVSNAYNAYWNTEIVVSNTLATYVSNPNTNTAEVIQDLLTGVSSSSSNVVNLVSQFAK
jgi:hypothetical protein